LFLTVGFYKCRSTEFCICICIFTTTGTFADGTVILARHDDPVTASHKLQGHLDQLEAWLKKWRININATKSVQVTFTLRKEQCPVVYINNTVIPQSPTAKLRNYSNPILQPLLEQQQRRLKKLWPADLIDG
jgi:hypothetical protein